MKRNIFWVVMLVVVLAIWSYSDLISYGIMQGKGQLKVLVGARPITEFLQSADYPDSLKARLRLIQEVRNYGFDHLGIFKNDNYTKMYDQQGKPTLWVLSACKPYELSPREWRFPLIGSFPYKGFFELDKARAERRRLDSLGLDTNLRVVSAWSTLGWFSDPVMSNFLNNNEGQLTELILHELTHGTLFVKDSVTFNENLATFIGHQGAIRFLSEKYGNNSAPYRKYIAEWTDERKFSNYMLSAAHQLDSVYQQFPEQMPEQQRNALKQAMIQQIVDRMDTVSFSGASRFRTYFKKHLPNNAFFMSFVRYKEYFDVLEQELNAKYGGDVERMLEDYKQKYPSM
ncbi:aminopeptidase [Persicobacter psychrovividus]|uniref:Aminopeptidase n=1 Tax=Persicobacter psychrovividus TaxID=387638 RepID=A0ABN6LEZ1_9BACT|nr:aminopeptidase [Persicobacter psychrovividus]